MFGGVDKEEYEKVVKANNSLRVKMEKLRLDNALLKDQIRALINLPKELSELYLFIQKGGSVTFDDLSSDKKFGKIKKDDLRESLDELARVGLLESIKQEDVIRYSIKTSDLAETWVPKNNR